jgi:hypothetical protein
MAEPEQQSTVGAGPYPVTLVDGEAVDRLIVTELKEVVLAYFATVGAGV